MSIPRIILMQENINADLINMVWRGRHFQFWRINTIVFIKGIIFSKKLFRE